MELIPTGIPSLEIVTNANLSSMDEEQRRDFERFKAVTSDPRNTRATVDLAEKVAALLEAGCPDYDESFDGEPISPGVALVLKQQFLQCVLARVAGGCLFRSHLERPITPEELVIHCQNLGENVYSVFAAMANGHVLGVEED